MEKKRNSPTKNLPPWRVTSEGGFWNVASRERPAILLPFGGEFQWFGSHWVVPGVYSTAKALVVDFCRQVDVDAMRAFQEKHHLTLDRDDIRNYTRGPFRGPPLRLGPVHLLVHPAVRLPLEAPPAGGEPFLPPGGRACPSTGAVLPNPAGGEGGAHPSPDRGEVHPHRPETGPRHGG